MDVPDQHLSTAAAFVQGGIQDACDDSCSICLEPFTESNPVTVTSCKHEYHLQCILEWSQRSRDCPMCLQHLALKDPTSQELLDAVHREREAAWLLFRNSTQGVEIHQVPVFSDDSDFEERIMQHLAAAARAHRIARRRDSHMHDRGSHMQDYGHFVSLPAHSFSQELLANGHVPSSGSFSTPRGRGNRHVNAVTAHMQRRWIDPVRNTEVNSVNHETMDSDHNVEFQPGNQSQQQVSPPATMSFSESLKSRFVAASTRYKETFTRTTRGFREKLRAHNNGMDLGARAREMGAGLARALERMSIESSGKDYGVADIPTSSGLSEMVEEAHSEALDGKDTRIMRANSESDAAPVEIRGHPPASPA